MASSPTASTGLVPIHIGAQDPAELQDLPPDTSEYARKRAEASARYAGVPWADKGVEPRWLYMDTSTCAAAIDPSIFHGSGGEEFERFLAGARARSEPALIVATLGAAAQDTVWNAFSGVGSDSLKFPGFSGGIAGKRLLDGANAQLAQGLDPADKDLGLRLLNRPPDAPWWSLALQSFTLVSGDGSGRQETRAPVGKLTPILLDTVGDPVAVRWVTGDGSQIWYVIPYPTDYQQITDWIVRRGLPAHVPAALRRVRARHVVDPDLETPAETAARVGLADLEQHYEQEKARLENELNKARSEAEPVREGLLYGSGRVLEEAVASLLRAAGFTVTDLDSEVGGPRSADFLAEFGGQACLIEVKSASRSAGEREAVRLRDHLEAWPELRPDQPVTCAAVIMNHQFNTEPAQRSPAAYSNKEFLAALPYPVLATLDLYEWWRTGKWDAIRAAVLDRAVPAPEQPRPTPSLADVPPGPRQTRSDGVFGRLRRRRGTG
ncbi:hypothetical protein PV350_40260 [Streptomyces sp. PA03-6a]|nr:hypothetical protein [Streptomyces sp. PA03-6a]